MATGIVIAGSGALRVRGKVYNCSAITATIGSVRRSKVVGMNGPAGDKVERVAPKLTATIIADNDTSLATVNEWENETAEVQFASGRSAVFEGASLTEPPEHNVVEGTFDVTLEAMSGTETGL